MDYSLPHDHRWRRLGRVVAWMLPLLFGLTWTVFWYLSRDRGYATVAASLETALVLVGVTLTAHAAWSFRLASPRRLHAVTGSWAALPALTVTLIGLARGLPAAPAAGLGVLTGVIAGLAYARLRGRLAALQRPFYLDVDTRSEAELVEAATRPPAIGPAPAVRPPPMERLNHARAQIFLAMRDGDFDQLIEALPALRETLQDRQLDPAIALLAGRDLMAAHSLLAQQGGALAGYGDAVELFAQLVEENQENPAGRAGRSVLHQHRAGYEQCALVVATQDLEAATRDHDQERARSAYERLCRSWHAVETELTTALRLASDGDDIVAEHLLMLGAHLSTSLECLGEDRCDEGVALCRRALALRAGRTRAQRPRSQLYLAQCLVIRGEQYEDPRDLDEAEVVLRRLSRLDNTVRARAQQLLLEIAVLRPGTRG